ncbi:MAG: right-handed parallel beta-helix repeat-containing protein [Ignavibacteriales bacterium]|nr:right-handed parallel beta-helix repeat-containing protein [Ignavibacteriales bacterium]
MSVPRILQIVPANTGGAKLDFVARNWTAGNGIIAGGANVFINNAIISNGSAGISAWNPASLSISNTTIENCWFGVAVQSRPIGSVYLDNVKVLNCDARGVTLDNANLEIKNSRISGSDIGLELLKDLFCRVITRESRLMLLIHCMITRRGSIVMHQM